MRSGRERVECQLYRFGSALARTVPLRALHAMVGVAARVIVLCRERRVRWALTNLRLAYPDASARERRRLMLASLVNLGWNLVDFLRMQDWTASDVRDHIELNGLEHLHRALEQGRGAILLVPHLGNFELGLQALAVAGVDCVVVERELRNAELHQQVHALRSRFGAQPVGRNGAARAIAGALRKGRVVVLAVDQYSGQTGRVFVPFFGLRVPTSSAPAVLARRSGTPVLPCCVVRDARDHHTGLILPPVLTQRTSDRQADVEDATSAFYASLEKLIRAYPEHWVWSYRRFRYSPDLEADPYQSR